MVVINLPGTDCSVTPNVAGGYDQTNAERDASVRPMLFGWFLIIHTGRRHYRPLPGPKSGNRTGFLHVHPLSPLQALQCLQPERAPSLSAKKELRGRRGWVGGGVTPSVTEPGRSCDPTSNVKQENKKRGKREKDSPKTDTFIRFLR